MKKLFVLILFYKASVFAMPSLPTVCVDKDSGVIGPKTEIVSLAENTENELNADGSRKLNMRVNLGEGPLFNFNATSTQEGVYDGYSGYLPEVTPVLNFNEHTFEVNGKTYRISCRPYVRRGGE